MEHGFPITEVLQHYFPGWEPPENEREWNPCLCPAHVEDRPSCSVNFTANAVRCMACGFKGNSVSIIRRKEGLSNSHAVRRAKEISSGSNEPVSQKLSRKSSRRVFGG